MKVLLTGGSGYIGSTLLRFLPRKWKIILVDIDKPKVTIPENAKFIKADITEPSIVYELTKDTDMIFHTAAIKNLANTSKIIETNVLGTHVLVKAALKNRINKFVFFSTYFVYGNNKLPFRETMPTRPLDLYALSKVISEQEIITSGLNYLIFRLTNVFGFGSGFKQEEVVYNFIESGLERRQLTIYGSGKNKIDLIYINDVCRIIVKILQNTEISNITLNIGSGKQTSILQLAELVSELLKKKHKTDTKITLVPTKNLMYDRGVSTNNLKKVLKNITLTSLEKAVELYISDLKGIICGKNL